MACCQPGMVSSRKPEAKLSRGMTGAGMWRPSTRPPISAARSDAASCSHAWASRPAITISTFQLRGRSAAADMRTHQLRLAFGELADTGDELERRPLVATHLLAQRDQLVGRREPRRHRSAVEVVVRRGPRRREPEAALGDRRAEELSHRFDLVRGRLPLRRRLAHHHPANRGVPDEEPGVRHQATLEPIEVGAERGPVPVARLLEGRDGHPLDAGEHVHEVVGLAGRERSHGEAAVPADHCGDAVHGRRATAWDPRTPGRRSACGGR